MKQAKPRMRTASGLTHEVHVVVGTSGCPSDKATWVAKAFRIRGAAERYAKTAARRGRACARWVGPGSEGYSFTKRIGGKVPVNRHDPLMQIVDDYPPEYRVELVELV